MSGHRLRFVNLLTVLTLVLSVTGIPKFVPVPSSVSSREYSSSVPQNDPANWHMIGQAGGPAQAVAVQGIYAYLGVGLRMEVMDISNPANPHQVGVTTPFPYFVEGIAVKGTLAYVAAGGAGLRVIDISDPVHPTELGAWDSPGYAEGVTVAGSIVYLADGPYGLRILDVSNPANPIPISDAYPTDYVFEVTVAGKVAYVAGGGAGLLLVDVSNPLYPVEISSLETPGYAYQVAVNGPKAYVADGWDGVRVIDVSDIYQPQEIGHYQTPGEAFDVNISGNRAYVADAFKGLQILDITNPAQPLELGGYSVAKGHAGHLAIVGNKAFVADTNWGLWIIDISNPAAPFKLGNYQPLSLAKAVAVSGDYAYVAAGDFGLYAVNIANPTLPMEVDTFATNHYASSVAVQGHYAYVATMDGQTLYVLDITNPSNIVLAGSDVRTGGDVVAGSGAYRDFAVSGGFAYLANETGLVIIDMSDPPHPHERGFISLREWPGGEISSASVGVVVKNGLAYVAAENTGIKIVDVSQPDSPTLIGNCRFDGAQDVVVAGTYAYVASANGLTVVDVTDPRNPVQRSFTATPDSAERIIFKDNIVYMSERNTGMVTIDVSNPLNPTLSGSYNTLGYAQDIVLDSDRVYVADDDGGLVILQKTSARQALKPFDIPTGAESRKTETGTPLAAGPSTGSGLLLPQDISAPGQSNDLLNQAVFEIPDHKAIVPALGASTTCVVNSKADHGVGTLRSCLENAQSGTTINFDLAIFPPTNPQTITLSSMLPAVSQGHITIDASNAGVILDGSGTPSGTDGLLITSSYNTIKGLQIIRFPQNGINFFGAATNNQIGGDRTKGNGPSGEGNLISGNGGQAGVEMNAGGSENNIVTGNLIGTDITGKAAFPNRSNGVFIGSPSNRIGGYTPGERNIISGNAGNGVGLLGLNANSNIVVGNYIGLDISGSIALGNGDVGVSIEMGAYHNSVKKNVIITTLRNGVLINDLGSSYNTVIGNLIGTDATGTSALGGGYNAIGIGMGAGYNRIGGKTPEDRNVIVGGIFLFRKPGIGNLIIGNFIGTNISGTAGLSEVGSGIGLDGCRYVFIGGNTPAERNVISGNSFGGIRVNPGVDYIFINRNYIGVDTSGLLSIGNGSGGIILDGVEHTFIQDNVIAYHTNPGIQVTSTGFNTIRQNAIYSNTVGIRNSDGGNDMLPAPVITLTNTSLSGSACPGCTVEFFFDSSDEGRIYIGNSIADASGVFSHPGACPVSYPNLTATTTDSDGNTSQFSSPQPVQWDCASPNPVPALASLDPITITAISPTFLLTATGVDFIPNSRIRWNSIDLPTTFISNTQLAAVVPSGLITLEGIANIIVHNPEPGGGISNIVTFTILPPKRVYLPIVSR